MTANEFNIKYFEWLESGHYGLDIDVPQVIIYLDKIFEEITKLPGFQYSQIKAKWHWVEFYSNLETLYPRVGEILAEKIKEDIQLILSVQLKTDL
jgi:hypothetical protein